MELSYYNILLRPRNLNSTCTATQTSAPAISQLLLPGPTNSLDTAQRGVGPTKSASLSLSLSLPLTAHAAFPTNHALPISPISNSQSNDRTYAVEPSNSADARPQAHHSVPTYHAALLCAICTSSTTQQTETRSRALDNT